MNEQITYLLHGTESFSRS